MKRLIQTILGVAVAGVLAWLLLRGTSWRDLGESMKTAKWGWVFLAQVPIWVSFFTRILRWGYIVRAVHPARFRHMLSATQIGFLVNFTINLRLGEVVRAWVLARLARLTFSKSLALAALDRVTDLVGLIVVLFVAAISFHPTRDIEIPANSIGNASSIPVSAGLIRSGAVTAIIGLVGLVAILVLLYIKQTFVIRTIHRAVAVVSERFARFVSGILQQFADGLHVFRSARDMAKSLGYSMVTWACFLVAEACFFNAFNFEYPWYALFVTQALLALAITLPGTPGYVGQFHLPIVAGIVMCVPGVRIADAKAVAITAHLFNLIPILLLGAFCLYWEGLNFFEVTVEGAKAGDAARGSGKIEQP